MLLIEKVCFLFINIPFNYIVVENGFFMNNLIHDMVDGNVFFIASLFNIKTTVIDWNGCYLFAWLTLFRFFYEHHCGWRKWFYFFTQLCATQNSFKSKKSFSSNNSLLWFNWIVIFFYSSLRYLLSKQMTLGSS